MSFYNPSNYSTKGAYLTKTEALKLFRQNTPNIFITGNEIVSGDESVYGNSNTETLTVTESAIINNLTTYGSTYIGTDNLQQHRVIGDLLLTKLPQLTSNITPTNDKDLTTKKYADDTFASKTGNNSFTGITTFPLLSTLNLNGTNNIFGINTISGTSCIFSIVPMYDIDRTSQMTDPKHFISKGYVDDKFGSKTGTNTFTGSNTFNNALIVQGTSPTPSSSSYMQVRYAAKFSETEGNVFYTIPKIDLVNPSITDDKHITTKKFVDDKFALAVKNTAANTLTGGLTEFQSGVRCRYNWTSDDTGTTFTTVPKFDSDRTAQMTNDNHLISKKYVDQLYAVPRNPSYPTKFLVCQQTSYEAINGKFKVSPPKQQNNGWDCYINFLPSSGSRVFMSNTVSIEVDWSYSHNKKLTNLGGYVNNGDGSYTFDNAPSSADIQNYFEHRTNIPSGSAGQYKTAYSSKSITAIYNLQPQSSIVKVNSVYQSYGLVSQSTSGGGGWLEYESPCTYPTNDTNESNTRVYWKCHPLAIIAVSDYKIRLNIKFPQLCKNAQSEIAQSNNPSLDGWISNAMCSISIRSSPFADSGATLLSSTAPNTSFRADTGNAYFTLT